MTLTDWVGPCASTQELRAEDHVDGGGSFLGHHHELKLYTTRYSNILVSSSLRK